MTDHNRMKNCFIQLFRAGVAGFVAGSVIGLVLGSARIRRNPFAFFRPSQSLFPPEMIMQNYSLLSGKNFNYHRKNQSFNKYFKRKKYFKYLPKKFLLKPKDIREGFTATELSSIIHPKENYSVWLPLKLSYITEKYRYHLIKNSLKLKYFTSTFQTKISALKSALKETVEELKTRFEDRKEIYRMNKFYNISEMIAINFPYKFKIYKNLKSTIFSFIQKTIIIGQVSFRFGFYFCMILMIAGALQCDDSKEEEKEKNQKYLNILN